MSIFTKSTILSRRNRLQPKWSQALKPQQCIVVFSGAPITRPGGLDQTYPFLPHPCYYWLTGRRRHHEAVAYSLRTGWVDFYYPISQAEVIWEGVEAEGASTEKSVKELSDWIKTNGFDEIFVMGQRDDIVVLPQKTGDSEDLFKLQSLFDSVRRVKDAEEIQIIERAAKIARKGYQKIREILQPGISEKEIQIQYESEILRNGASGVPYDTIVGSGERSAILHALPTQKIIKKNDLVLIDAGVDIEDYCVDITRVLYCTEKTSQQKDLHELVQITQSACIRACSPGVFWNQIHLQAARQIAQGLKDLNILKVQPEEAVESEVVSVFFPHGVGHLVGLRVRDVGHTQNTQPKKYAGATIRFDLELEENHLVTVEPGCYFIKALLDDPQIRMRYKDLINWNEVEKWMSIGGVRIEDDILITSNGPKSLTEIVEK